MIHLADDHNIKFSFLCKEFQYYIEWTRQKESILSQVRYSTFKTSQHATMCM